MRERALLLVFWLCSGSLFLHSQTELQPLTGQSTQDNLQSGLPAPRDTISAGILQLLAKQRTDLVVSAQIRRFGDADGQTNPLTISVSTDSASALVDETKTDGKSVRSILYEGQRTYLDRTPADTLNSVYLLIPQFDLADELARPDLAIEAGVSSPGRVEIRIHSARPIGLPGELDKIYVIDSTLYQIVSVMSTVKVGTSLYSHELRYSNYQLKAGGLALPSKCVEILNGEQLWQIDVIAAQ